MANLFLILALVLATGFLATRLAKILHLPHSVLLVLLGLLAGWVIRTLNLDFLPAMTKAFPHIILFALLPPLIFESAYHLHFKDLKKDIFPITGLAIFGLMISATLICWGLHLFFGIPILAALIFGTLISATDPVAVVSLFKEVGAPTRLNTLVEGESLFNDGTAIVIFNVLLAAIVVGQANASLIKDGLIQFFVVSFGGIAVGLATAFVVSQLLRITHSGTGQIGLTVSAAYARPIAIFTTLPVISNFKLCQPISLSFQMILVWGGLRGGLALALVLMLPDSFAYKNLFIALATAVVLSTLLINALTINTAMKWLGITNLSRKKSIFFRKAMDNLYQSVFHSLQQAASRGTISPNIVTKTEASIHQTMAEHLPASISGQPVQSNYFEIKKLLLSEQGYYDDMLEDRVLSKKAYITLSRFVKDRVSLMQTLSKNELIAFPFTFDSSPHVFHIFWSRLFKRSREASVNIHLIQYEVLFHLNISLQTSLKQTDHLKVQQLGGKWLSRAHKKLQTFYTLYPECGSAMQAKFIVKHVTAASFAHITLYHDRSLLDATLLSRATKLIDSIHHILKSHAKEYLEPDIPTLLKNVPLFQLLPDSAITMLTKVALVAVHEAGKTIVNEGDQGDSLFIVTAGVLEVQGSKIPPNKRPHLVTGDFFGEFSLLDKSRRTATVLALVDCRLLEINDAVMSNLMVVFPDIKSQMQAIANKRKARWLPSSQSA